MCQDAKTPHLRNYTLLFNETTADRWGESHTSKMVKAHGIEFDPDSGRVALWRRAAASEIEQTVAVVAWSDILAIYEDASEQVPDTVPEEWETASADPDVPF